MITSLKLTNFKNFQQAALACGPLTLLMGTNASGKSNLRDAFRFLHGIGRRYSLAEITGEKYGPGSELVWDGIRGGIRELAYRQAETFALEVQVEGLLESPTPCVYRIQVAPDYNGGRPRVVAESLYYGPDQVFAAYPFENDPDRLWVSVLGEPVHQDQRPYRASRSVLTQLVEPFFVALRNKKHADFEKLELFETLRPAFIETLGRIRFLEPTPAAMRQPSTPGQELLGGRGEHLASVLQTLCETPSRKAGLLSWLRSLTPVDVVDVRFKPDLTGKVLLVLVEKDGQEVSAYSASDGTLRFLALLAALLGAQLAPAYFFEELENGIHPTRLHLLLDLIEQNVARGAAQVIATTHSPHLLRLVNAETLRHTSLIYRLENQLEGRICRLIDLPESARQVLEKKDPARLHASGWFENVVSFLREDLL